MKMSKKNINTQNPQVAEILGKPYALRITPDETGKYTATILEFPGCIASGNTPTEAIENFYRVAESWVTVALANNFEIREPVDFYGYSGKISLRIPRTLHRQVAEYAELEGVSINQLLVHAISNYIGGIHGIDKLAKKYAENIRSSLNVFVCGIDNQSSNILIEPFGNDTGKTLIEMPPTSSDFRPLAIQNNY